MCQELALSDITVENAKPCSYLGNPMQPTEVKHVHTMTYVGMNYQPKHRAKPDVPPLVMVELRWRTYTACKINNVLMRAVTWVNAFLLLGKNINYMIYLIKMSRMSTCIEIGSRLQLCRLQGGEASGECQASFWGEENVLNLDFSMVAQLNTIFKTTEFNTIGEFYYVQFIFQ